MIKHNAKRRVIVLLCFVMAVFLVFAAMPYQYFEVSAIDTSKDNEEALKAKLAQYQSEGEEIKKKLDQTKSDIEEKENEKEYLDSLVVATENEIEAANALLDEYAVKISQKEGEIATAETDIENKYQELLGRLSFVYEEENRENYLDMVFNADSLSDAMLTAERVGSMLDFDNSLMSELSAKLELLKSEKTALETTKAEQEALKVSLTEKEKELEKQKADVENYIKQLEQDEASYQAEYEKAKAAEQKANSDIERLLKAREEQQRAAEGGGSFTYTGGTFSWPVPASYSRVSSGYGWRVLWGRMDFHLGIDIPVPYGTNIFASKAGTVVTATWHYSYGNYVLIDHGDGSATLYAHNSKLLVSAGDTVDQGTPIARAGSTGSSTGNHLHFEVRLGGSTVDPLNYVSRP